MAATWNLELLWVIVQVSLGLGAVIFVHELGHFLVAKACGVKCEKFYIGFDIGGYKFWHRKWGETEYGIGVLPLGGYVKMLGQDDNPSKIADETERSRLPADDEADGPTTDGGVTDTDEGNFEINPRSYLAKSVPQRMAIISAGVIMNLIFAVLFATIAYSMGVKYMPAVVSDVEPGSPAWRSDVRPGDRIVRIGDRDITRFRSLQSNVALGNMEDGIPFKIRRPGHEGEIALTLRPEHGKSKIPTIGIRSPASLTIRAIVAGSQAAAAEPPLKKGDKIVSINGTALSNGTDLMRIRASDLDVPLQVTVRRKLSVDGGKEEDTGSAADTAGTEEITTTIAPAPMQRLGLVMEMGPVAAIKTGSPAEQADIRVGDRLLTINGQAVGDPMTLAARIRQMGHESGEVEITLRRTSDKEGASEDLTKTVKVEPPRSTEQAVMLDPMVSIPGVGLAYRVFNKVAAVRPGSPAAKAGIVAGSEIVSAKFLKGDAKSSDEVKGLSKLRAMKFTAEMRNWPLFLANLQSIVPGMKVSLEIREDPKAQDDEPKEIELASVASSDFFVASRGMVVDADRRLLKADSLGQAFDLGLDETKFSVLLVYRFLQKLGEGQISVTALGGPLTIARAAGHSAFDGIPTLLVFLTMLSANLAVINFLPIPLLDGGHMIFLTWEGVFRKPMSERIVIAFHILGFAFIIGLMLFVIGLDLGWLFGLT